MVRLKEETIKRLDDVCFYKANEAKDKGLLDLRRLIKKRYVTHDTEINYLIDLWEKVQEAKKIKDSKKFMEFIIKGSEKINRLFQKKSKVSSKTLKSLNSKKT